MRRLAAAGWIFVLVVPLLAGSEWAAQRLDPATPDERAVLDRYLPMIAVQDCVPAQTSIEGETLRDRRWMEVEDGEVAQVEAAARRASMRGETLRTESGWMLPMAASVIGSLNCSHPVRVMIPGFAGNYAFVTAATDGGVSTSAFRRRPDGWVWIGAAWRGNPIIQY